ncbi:YitT family protein [Cytobacillus firmus]|uniref:YitT family protein n=1 Tax=Cytobacillus firmus TaxID=1399 RepID=UPI0021616327|nr:YitT family protein [Cytobacillus firmus]MCS0672790.1 YitT family protein [Cytobacillus firmus]
MYEKLFATLIGSLLLGIGINGFLVPHHLLDGGIIGIGLILHYYYELPTGLSMIVLSIPLYVLAWFYEKKYFFYSLHGLLISSFIIDLLSAMRGHFDLSILPSSILGGCLVGFGIGLMLRYETSTGGTDLLAQLMTKLLPINIGALIFAIDGLVILSGLKIVGIEKFLYSFITIIFVGVMTSLTVIRKEQNIVE